MAQAVTCGLLIAESRVQYQVNVYGICGGITRIGSAALFSLPNICDFSCQYYATGAPSLFNYFLFSTDAVQLQCV